MIKKGSVHSVGCYWRCHLPQNKCHCLPITQSCRFLLPVNEHSPHVKSPATTYYYNVHCAAAAGGESPPRTFTFVTTDLSCKIFFEKNNTVVITKLLTDKTSKDLVLLIEWKISMRDYDHNYSECYFFHIRFNLHQRDLPVSLYPAYLSGYETWLPFLLLLPIALLHWSDDTNKICKVEKISGNHLGGDINPRDVTAVTFISLVFESIG